MGLRSGRAVWLCIHGKKFFFSCIEVLPKQVLLIDRGKNRLESWVKWRRHGSNQDAVRRTRLALALAGWGRIIMDGGAQPPNHRFRISPVNRLGWRISPSVLDAAEKVERRAIEHAEKEFIDPAIAASLLEDAAATVSRVLEVKRPRNQNAVRDLPSYLFRAFLRRVNRIKKQQLLLDDADQARSAGSHSSTDPHAEFEMKILVDELLARSDPVTRDMFYRRIQGFSWREIGLSYGISRHDAEARFSQTLHKIGKRLGLKGDL